MALFIFITFQLLLQVRSQGLPQANLTIFPTFANNEEKVRMVCGGYENHRVSECMFYLSGQEDFKTPSGLCNLTLTIRKLIMWSRDSESSHINISCYYSVYSLGENATSPPSDKVPVRVRGLAAMSSLSPITEDSPTTLIPNGTSEANLSSASTTDTTLVSVALAVTSSTEIITDPITITTDMSSITNDSSGLTSPANASLESTTLAETTEHASVVSVALAVTSSTEIITDPITSKCCFPSHNYILKI
ncbi:transcription initiation factor TFIID subunit 12-like isoform X2 [Pseudorasbora parva]|uniref:transcription initiation factor TFIID subunit 12-like isoform X2 n=1 Tax=Pseudorasbora parva TaxID=51549 RepID=UPI00351ED5A5